MTKNEAIILLMKCHPFAKKLVSQGVNIVPNGEDRTALYDFGKVWASGWLEGYSVQRLAGLSSNEINSLTITMIKVVTQPVTPKLELAATGS